MRKKKQPSIAMMSRTFVPFNVFAYVKQMKLADKFQKCAQCTMEYGCDGCKAILLS